MHLVAPIRLSIRVFTCQQRAVRVITTQRRLCICNQRAYTDNSVDAVDLLLIV